MNSIDDDFLQYIFNIVQKGYEDYKKEHPDFAKVVENEDKPTHCTGCGEWLEGFDTCQECGRINL